MTIELSPETEAKLRKFAAVQGVDFHDMGKALLSEAIDFAEREFEETIAGIERGLKACEAGRTRPTEEFFEKARRRRAAELRYHDARKGSIRRCNVVVAS